MSTENEVLKKIQEISLRAFTPRPLVNSSDVAKELALSQDNLFPILDQLKYLKLVAYNDKDAAPSAVRLTLLGSIVKR